jgi:hypothetical protein
MLYDIYNPGAKLKVKSPVGVRIHPILNVSKEHAGIDYSKAEGVGSILGLPIPAAANGVVVDKGNQVSGDGTGWGNYVVIQHTWDNISDVICPSEYCVIVNGWTKCLGGTICWSNRAVRWCDCPSSSF